MCVLCLTSHQQLRSCGGGDTANVSYDRLMKPGFEPATPGLKGKWFIDYYTAAPIYPDQTDCIGLVGSGSTLME